MLTEAGVLKKPLVALGVTWEEYLSILRTEAIKHREKPDHKHKFELAVDLLVKWVNEDYDLSAPAANRKMRTKKVLN